MGAIMADRSWWLIGIIANWHNCWGGGTGWQIGMTDDWQDS